MARPPAPALDVIAARSSAGTADTAGTAGAGADITAPASTTAAAAGPAADDTNSLPVPLVTEDSTSRDSRSSSSTNSPVPADNEESDFFLANNDSQSSLGVVPNLQDMQVTDPECLPTVAALPSEILISIFSRISEPKELLNCMLTCKRWARNVVEILWHRPSCTTWEKHSSICSTLGLEQPFFTYTDFIKRLNLAALADGVNDGSVTPLAVCTRVERLTLTNCRGLTDVGLTPLVRSSQHLLALDISGDDNITEASIIAIAENCRKLQGLNISGCRQVSNESLVQLAESCRFIKRLKLNDCNQLNDTAVLAFANHCPNILEIDLHQCTNIGNEPVSALLAKEQALRELRLASCELVDDGAFLALPPYRTYENLRILDLTSCSRLTDRAVEKIIDIAPRLRNLVLAKCSNITDVAVHAIAKLQKNLHYVHLGHCRHITDDAVKRLVRNCNRIRYIDLGCCTNLTDESVTLLAGLPKLKRIGLVKCANITDKSMYALATANDHRSYRNTTNHPGHDVRTPSLERVHLSYCTNLTLPSIIKLLNCCPKLTHLSLTGVPAFLRDDLDRFCREAPSDFTEHQRAVFCVFSGAGVAGLRHHLNTREEFAEYREGRSQRRRPGGVAVTNAGQGPAPFVEVSEDGDGLEDDDMGDGSDLIDFNADLTNLAHNPLPAGTTLPLDLNAAQPHINPALDTIATHTPASTNEVILDGQGTVAAAVAGPSTAGSGLFDNLASSPGPSTASMQAQIDNAEAQTP
ncbi:hypothetical protein E0Z10_g1585 [Xylaria hypoxylon]|uniref:F-box domain-containing protein n=1 Tax=Xylaria hypoxylon TaxID=37992 RepID=A0A4Z0ZC85_9PEZI|nr:hypothetical protein E0Z10_g1585 [Xylaria hypoxylon]